MNDNDIKKCIKNGYGWDSLHDYPHKTKCSGYFPKRMLSHNWLHATKSEAQLAIATRREDERVAKRKADAAHAKMLEDGKTQMTPITPEQAKLLRAGDIYWIEPTRRRHLIRDGFENTPEHIKSISDGAFFTSKAAQTYRDKANGVESHETPIGETQPKEVATDEPQDKPTTVRGWLDTIPDPAIRRAALGYCSSVDTDKECTTLYAAIATATNPIETVEGGKFWHQCMDADYYKSPWPSYPPKTKQVKDGWTDEEIEKSVLKPKEWTDIPQVVTKRNNEETPEEKLTHSVVLDKKFTTLIKVLSSQVGGNHYLNKPIQPVLYCAVNGLDDDARAIIKYVTRHCEKGKHADLDKAIQYLLIMRAKCYPDAPECQYSVKTTSKEQK